MQLNEVQTTEVRSFGRLINYASVLCFFIMALGATVRANDAGLACPDWPLCYNRVIPIFDLGIFLEWFHRVVAGGLTILLLVASWRIIRSTTLRREFGSPIVAAMVLLGVQIVLGGLTVLHLLEPKIVAAHLVNALLFFSVLLWMAMRARAIVSPNVARQSVRATPAFRWTLTGLLGLLFAQLVVGGMVSTNQAGLACPDFPKCHGMWLPPVSFHITLQVLHRYLGYAVALGAVAVWMLATTSHLGRLPRLATRLLPALVLAQIALGIVNVIWLLPEWASVAHLANAVLIFALLLLAVLDVWIAAGFNSAESLARSGRASASDSVSSLAVSGKAADGLSH